MHRVLLKMNTKWRVYSVRIKSSSSIPIKTTATDSWRRKEASQKHIFTHPEATLDSFNQEPTIPLTNCPCGEQEAYSVCVAGAKWGSSELYTAGPLLDQFFPMDDNHPSCLERTKQGAPGNLQVVTLGYWTGPQKAKEERWRFCCPISSIRLQGTMSHNFSWPSKITSNYFFLPL